LATSAKGTWESFKHLGFMAAIASALSLQHQVAGPAS
jgi:hypothetical protein